MPGLVDIDPVSSRLKPVSPSREWTIDCEKIASIYASSGEFQPAFFSVTSGLAGPKRAQGRYRRE
jgi:hypothetical protein